MKHSELLFRLFIITGILVAIGAPLYFWKNARLIHARMAENGGWTPNVIQAQVGRPLHLKFTWRMRGTIEVSGSLSEPEPAPAPLYVSLGLNLDAPHDAPVVPSQKPSVQRGQ